MPEGMTEDEAVQSLAQAGLLDDQTSDYGMADEDMRKLFDLVERDVIAWRPQPGDKVGGYLRDLTDSEEGEYGTYPIITIETPNGRMVAIHCFHRTLRKAIETKLRRGTLKNGDRIAIMYVGLGEKKGTRDAPNLYRVVVGRPQ
jgi:hypothetical protein